MTTFIQFLVFGVATGAVYTLLAQGIVVIHRASGVINLAQGGIAVIAGFFFSSLISAHGWPIWPAFAVITLGAAVAGVGFYLGIMRRLRTASQLTQIIATLGLLIILQSVVILVWNDSSVTVSQYLPTAVYDVSGVYITLAQIVLTIIAFALTGVFWALMRYSLIGIAIRGVAENRRASAALGWSPDKLAGGSWALGAAVGAAAGMLIAPVTGVQVENITLLLVAALAAGLVGGFTSFPLTLLGAMGIAIGQSLVGQYVNVIGLGDALPVVVITVVLMLRGQSIPIRGHLAEPLTQLGSGRVNLKLVAIGTAVTALLVWLVFSQALAAAIGTTLIIAIVLLSIVVLTGFCGQLSLAQLTFGGVAALITGRLIQSAGFPFLPAALIGVLGVIPLGLLFALPALRTRGLTLAIVTFSLGSAVTAMVFSQPKIIGGDLGTPVGPLKLFGWDVDSGLHPARYTLVVLVVFVICALAVANLRRSRVGRKLIAVRANERAASSLGISVYAAKLYAFGLSAAMAGVGGILLAFQFQTIDYSAYDPVQSLSATSFAVVGGLGFSSGAVPGATLAPGGFDTWVTNLLGTGVSQYLPLVGGVALLLVVLQNPNGIMATITLQFRRWFPRREAPPSSLGAVNAVRVSPAVLEVRDLTVRFGGVTAVERLNLNVQPGRVYGLIGPNGAGKTTAIDAITGFVAPSAGSVVLDGKDVTVAPAYQRARYGISRSFQSLELFEGISVRENLLAASEPRDAMGYVSTMVRPGGQQVAPAAVAAIREFGLEDDLEKHPASLSYGRRRLVAIARAVASQPSVLLLDEPVAGLDETEAAEIAHLVRGLAENWGIGILLVEHDMSFVMSTCDEITVIDFGKMIAHAMPSDIRADPRVIAAYLGEPEPETVDASPAHSLAPQAHGEEARR